MNHDKGFDKAKDKSTVIYRRRSEWGEIKNVLFARNTSFWNVLRS